jgi:phosphate:Na+ symporter
MNIIDVLNLLGGLALFLFGMNKMSDNLQAVAGNELRRILKKTTNTPFKGVLMGIGITAIIQSSSATSVMIIGLVNAGIMSLQQAVGVVMGANIGTTITAQLIAFNIGDIAYAFVIIGVIGILVKRSRKMEHWSLIILGFGLLFIGLGVMSDAVSGLKNSSLAMDIMANAANYPILAILAGAVFTMLIQSSSASVGIVIVLANTGLIPFDGAIYLVLGDNIGTTITAWLASLGGNNSARRVAMVHTIFNLFGTILFALLAYYGFYKIFINYITPGDVFAGENVARHVANAHTFFNVLNTIVMLPLAGFLAFLARSIIPKDPEDMISLGEPKHLNYHLINDSYLAIDQSFKEMREMLRLVRLGLNVSYEAFREKNFKKQERVTRIEAAIDHLQQEITRYLVSVNERTNADSIIKKIPALLHTVNDIEKIGDFTVDVNHILNYQIPLQRNGLCPEFLSMIDDFHMKVKEMLGLSIEYLEEFKPKYIYKIIELEGRINEMHHTMREKIMLQIQKAECDPVGGLNTIDYIDAMEMMADKMKNIVKAGTHDFTYKYSTLSPDEDKDHPAEFDDN